MYFDISAPDKALLQFVNQDLRCGLMDWIMPVFSSQALLWLIGLAALAWLVRKRGKRQIICFLVILAAVGLTDLSTQMVKQGFGRVRPLNSVPGVWFREDGQWQQLPEDFKPTKTEGSSYISAHAANSMAVAVMAMLFWPASRPWMLLLPLLTGLSRLYLGKHFPSDVLAGWLFGLVVAGFVYFAFKALGGPLWIRGPDKPDEP